MKTVTVFAGLAIAAPALAQTDIAPRPDAATSLPAAEAITVTATRSPAAIDRVAASVTVLDKAALDRAGDFAVADILVRTPGVTLSRNGGPGTATSLRIRGAEGDQTVVVIDGVKLNDPSAVGGGYDFGRLLVGDAARVEVLRGPQSTLWGSQAIGGVVNIVTPLPDGPLEGSFDIEGGSRDTASGRAAIGGRTGPLAFRIGGQAFTTDGISALAPPVGRERDGYRNRTAMGRAVLDLATGVSAEVRGYYSDARVAIDGFGTDSAEYGLSREFVGYAGLNVDLLDGRLRNRFGYGLTDTDRDNYDPARARQLTFSGTGRNERLEYQGTLAILSGIDAVFGAEHEESRFRTVSAPFSATAPLPAPSRAKAEITSVYGQINAGLADGLTLTGGVRRDDHSRFGGQTLFAAGGVYAAPWGMTLRASYGEGFKAPTLYQLFSEYGNAGLSPERARGWEAGAEQSLAGGRATIGATWFQRRSRDLIAFASCTGASADPLCRTPGGAPRFGYYTNLARAFARGIEAAARAEIMTGLVIDGNYSWIASEERSPGSPNAGRQLARRPRHAWNVGASYTAPGGASLGVMARHAGESFENASNSLRLAPYTLVDLRAELPLSAQVRLFVRAENVADERYETALGYGTLGRSVYAGLRGRF